MDLATIIGIALGLFFIISQIVSGGNAEIFIHIPSMMIVAGGTLAATLAVLRSGWWIWEAKTLVSCLTGYLLC